MFERLKNENEEQFLWRLGQAKDNGIVDFSWVEIADIMNKEFREDITDYRSEAAYRKPYQYTKKFYEAGTFTDLNSDKYISELTKAKHEVKKEKQKLTDERTALNRMLRNNARAEEDLQKLESLIIKNGKTTFTHMYNSKVVSDNDLFVILSDFHLGYDTDNYFGKYNSNIAKERLQTYLQKIIDIKTLHRSENVYVCLLGDIINGNIHFTVQLENRENVVEQVQKSAELISAFVAELSTQFTNVYVNGVAGNHSRTSFKDQVLRDNRLDNLVPWYMKAKLSSVNNVKFTDKNNYDATIGYIEVRNHKYILVHGDFDSFSEKGVSKLVMLLGYKPTAIFYGHFHRCSYDEIAGVKLIRSGSFSGTSDDYTISKRLSGKPSQMICVVNNTGIEAYYPVDLTKPYIGGE